MTDDVDRANERADLFLSDAIRNATIGKPLPPPSGLCFNCDAPVHGSERWCDTDCRDDWIKREHQT